MACSQNLHCLRRDRERLIQSIFIPVVSLITLYWPSLTAAQESTVANADSGNNQEQVMEEVKVIGMRDLLSLQRQVYKAEDRFYELFNELNDDDLYDIHCVNTERFGSRIRFRQCLPNFYIKATADESQGWLDSLTGNYGFVVPSNSVTSHYYPILETRMKELVKTNPELLERVTELYQLSEKLDKDASVYFEREDK